MEQRHSVILKRETMDSRKGMSTMFDDSGNLVYDSGDLRKPTPNYLPIGRFNSGSQQNPPGAIDAHAASNDNGKKPAAPQKKTKKT